MPEWIPIAVNGLVFLALAFVALKTKGVWPALIEARDAWRSVAEGRQEKLKDEKEKHETEIKAWKDGIERLTPKLAEMAIKETARLSNEQWGALYSELVLLCFPLIVKSYGLEETKRIVSEFDFKNNKLKGSLLWGLNILEGELSAP